MKQYWEKLKDTNISDDDYYGIFDNGQYELFILLNNMHFSKMKRINPYVGVNNLHLIISPLKCKRYLNIKIINIIILTFFNGFQCLPQHRG